MSMFGSSKESSNPSTGSGAKPKNGNPGPSAPSHALNSLVGGTMVEGTLRSDNDIRIDGAIKGKLFCNAKVIIGPTGSVEGEIKCQNAVIEGKFNGVLEVADLLNIRESAQVDGDISTGKLIVQAGAIFNVKCVMGNAKPSSLSSFSPTIPAKEDKGKSDETKTTPK